MEKTKNNRRSLLIMLAILLIAVATAFVGTFASYIISREVSDSATVAKFGLNIPATINLFSDSYTNAKADTEGKKIIAPGTDGQYKFEVTGTSEVAYKVSANIEVAYSDAWNGYEPLEFSIDGTTWTNFDQFHESLNDALASNVLPPNTAYASTQTIYWRWPFFVSSSNDEKDAEIGIQAAEGTAATVEVNIEVIAAQVD